MGVPETKSCLFPTNLISSNTTNPKPHVAHSIGNLFDLLQQISSFQGSSGVLDPNTQQIKFLAPAGTHVFTLEKAGRLIAFTFFPNDDDEAELIGLTFSDVHQFVRFFSQKDFLQKAQTLAAEIN